MTSADRISVEAMRPEDVPEAAAIEALSMPRPWPPQALLRDLSDAHRTCYFVARSGPSGRPAEGSDGGSGEGRREPGVGAVVGFVGAWLQVDEYHVTTLAVHPEWRRRGIGERLMRRLMARAVEIGAEAITLEVRVGNGAARGLYAKLGFKEVGLRRRYYADNNEDAVICTIPSTILERFSRRAGEGRANS